MEGSEHEISFHSDNQSLDEMTEDTQFGNTNSTEHSSGETEQDKKKKTKKTKLKKTKSKSKIEMKKREARTEILAQPKRARNKRYKLERSNSKTGFGSGSTRDLFFGLIPTEGADSLYLKHGELEQKNAAQSAFKSKTFLKKKVPFGPLTDGAYVDLQHGELSPSPVVDSAIAPFGTTDDRFKMYDYYHFGNRNPDSVAPGTYFKGDLTSKNKTPRDITATRTGMHPHSLAFQQKHKNFRSTSDLQIRKVPSMQASKRGAQSTLTLPVHLVRHSSSKKIPTVEPDTKPTHSLQQELDENVQDI